MNSRTFCSFADLVFDGFVAGVTALFEELGFRFLVGTCEAEDEPELDDRFFWFL